MQSQHEVQLLEAIKAARRAIEQINVAMEVKLPMDRLSDAVEELEQAVENVREVRFLIRRGE